MTQQVKTLAAKPDNLSLSLVIVETLIVKTTSSKLYPNLYIQQYSMCLNLLKPINKNIALINKMLLL